MTALHIISAPHLAIIPCHLEQKVALRATVLTAVALHDGGAGGHVQHHLVQRGGETAGRVEI